MGTTQTILPKALLQFFMIIQKILKKYIKIEANTVKKIEKYGFIKQGQLIVCNILTQ